MGTYTTNYNLFMPTIGEQGWGDLVNGNFTTIDTAMAGLNTRMGTAESNITSLTSRMGTAETTITSNTSRIGTLETENGAIDARVTVLENGEFNGEVSAEAFNGALVVNTTSDANYTIGTYTVTPETSSNSVSYSFKNKSAYGEVSITIQNVNTSFKKGFVQNGIEPVKITAKISANVGNTNSSVYMARVYKNGEQIATSGYVASNPTCTATVYVLPNDVISGDFYCNANMAGAVNGTNTLTLSNLTGNLYLA